MIGNDIVYFPLYINKKYTSNQLFLNKVFDLSELQIIHLSINPEKTLWVLWSLKEAAYKAQYQKNRLRKIIPKKLKIIAFKPSQSGFTSTILTPEGKLYGESFLKDDYVHSIVYLKDIRNHILKKTGINHISSIDQIKEEIAVALPKNTLFFKQNDLPYIQINEVKIPASVSHDGPYFGIVY